jgi:hypothetical protein
VTHIAVEVWERMNEPERILFCKLMTGAAMKLAKTSSPQMSEAFLQLARSWSMLANEVSRQSAERVNRDPATAASSYRTGVEAQS